MDFGKAITFVMDDENWISKVVIGSIVLLITSFTLIPFPILIGYQIGVMRNVANGEKNPLPEWNDWGKFFMDGLYVMIAYLVYTLPAWLLVCIGLVITFSSSLTGNESVIAAVSGVTFMVLMCFFFLFIIALAFITPAINIQYVRTGEFASCFRFGEVIGIARRNIVDILLTAVIILAASLLIQMASGILFITICGPFIISIAGSFWVMLSTGHLYGQIAAKELGKAAAIEYP